MATVSVGRPLGQCRCCLNFGHHKDIMEPFYREGVEEVYLDAILHCFNLRLSSDAKLPKMICKSCIHRLNYAAEFKAMVIESEQELLKVLNGNIEFVNVAECNNRGVEDENPGYNTRIFKKGDESIKEEIEEEEILEINNIADEEVETNNADESVDKEVCVKEEDILEKNNIADEEVETNNADGSVDGDSITDEEDESNNVANDEISILYSAIDKPVKTSKFNNPVEKLLTDKHKKGRKRKHSQTRTERKERKYSNLEYTTVKFKKVEPKVFKDYKCGCRMTCADRISVEKREQEFNQFVTLGSFNAQVLYIGARITEGKKRRRYAVLHVPDEKKRPKEFSRTYTLDNIQVCKEMFLHTLQITCQKITTAMKKIRNGVIRDDRGRKRGGLKSSQSF